MAKHFDERVRTERQKSADSPFSPGSMVVVTLGNPRDKFWGVILSLAPEGLALTGIELASFEDLIVMVKAEEPYTPAVVFFPMHRIERVELDLPDGNLASLSQRFQGKTGVHPITTFAAVDRRAEPSPVTRSEALPKKVLPQKDQA